MAGFTQGLSDLRALELYASLTSKEKALSLVEDFAGKELTFTEYPRREGFCVELREKLNRAIKESLWRQVKKQPRQSGIPGCRGRFYVPETSEHIWITAKKDGKILFWMKTRNFSVLIFAIRAI